MRVSLDKEEFEYYAEQARKGRLNARHTKEV